MVTSFRIKSTVRGHHVYKASCSPYIGEELLVQREVTLNNIHDNFAVAVLKNSNTVGHVPRKIFFTESAGTSCTRVAVR